MEQRNIFVETSMIIDLVEIAVRDANAADNSLECFWKFTTSADHILVLSAPNLEQLETFISVSYIKIKITYFFLAFKLT